MSLSGLVGSVVLLKSGGPHMVVYDVQDEELACIWADGTGGVRMSTFPKASVRQELAAPYACVLIDAESWN